MRRRCVKPHFVIIFFVELSLCLLFYFITDADRSNAVFDRFHLLTAFADPMRRVCGYDTKVRPDIRSPNILDIAIANRAAVAEGIDVSG